MSPYTSIRFKKFISICSSLFAISILISIAADIYIIRPDMHKALSIEVKQNDIWKKSLSKAENEIIKQERLLHDKKIYYLALELYDADCEQRRNSISKGDKDVIPCGKSPDIIIKDNELHPFV